MFKKIIRIIIIYLILISSLNAKEIKVFDFTENELKNLKVKKSEELITKQIIQLVVTKKVII